MALLLKGAHLVDPSIELDGIRDVLVEDGKIVRVGEDLACDGAETIDLSGKYLIPGLVDLHVHFREPGQEYKETIASGCRAAAHGGFTDVAPMPNTKPVADEGAAIEFIISRAQETGCVHVHPVGAITHGLKGEALSEMGDMVLHGAEAFSDDGRGVQDDGMMRIAFDYAKQFDVPLLSHCQRESLSAGGVVNEGEVSTRLGMAGWPAAAEEIQIERDLMLAELTGGQIHIQHCTTARGVELVAEARERGVRATCEVTPHHLFLCEDDLDETYNTNLKMNPPLRTREDMLALQEALCNGQADIIATDHAPHAPHEKEVEFELASFGTTGLETALPLVLTNLVKPGKMSWQRLVECMAIKPREIIHAEQVQLKEGSVADLTAIDPDAELTVSEEWFCSKGKNNAFLGAKLTGKATETIVGGRLVMRDACVL